MRVISDVDRVHKSGFVGRRAANGITQIRKLAVGIASLCNSNARLPAVLPLLLELPVYARCEVKEGGSEEVMWWMVRLADL